MDLPPLNFRDADVVADLFNRAAEANLGESRRKGATVHLPRRGRLLMTGDLHDHTPNLQKILRLAELDESPERHVIIHEVIHGPHLIDGRDLSVRTLGRVAQLKLAFPEQVHLMQANHEIAQLGGEGISKGGVNVCDAFRAGVDFVYADAAPAVHAAIERFIRSLLLAVRCENGVFCCHSLPSPRKLETFDPAVVERVPTAEDLARGGSGYDMVWGRFQTQELADRLGARWNAKVFLMGHQPAEMGYDVQGTSMLILASNHEHGVALPIDLAKGATIDTLLPAIVPLAGVGQ